MIRGIMLALIIGASASAGIPAHAQQTRTAGTVIVAHGGSAAWNQRVLDVARLVNTGGPVEVAFLMGPDAGQHRYQDAVARLAEHGVSEIVIVPLLVSSHSGHYEQIRWLAAQTDTLAPAMQHHLRMSGLERASVSVPLRISRALDDATELADVLAERALGSAAQPSGQALFLVAHGPNGSEDAAAWMTNLRAVAARVHRLTGFADVRVGMIHDDAPEPVRAEAVRRVREIIELQNRATQRDVVVVPVLISKGAVGDEKIPADLADLPILYRAEPLLPHATMARWIERAVKETRVSSRDS
jgi:sirohydrochlorin ferrochelatase